MKRSVTLAFLFLTCWLSTILVAQPGVLDEDFGTGGTTTLPVYIEDNWEPSSVEAVLTQPDGKLLLVGKYGFDAQFRNGKKILARLDVNGQLDADFANGGWLLPDEALNWSHTLDPQITDDGSILLAGHRRSPQDLEVVELMLARLLPNGQLDAAFGVEGVATETLGSRTARVLGLHRQADGGFLVAGLEGSKDLSIYHFDAQGQLQQVDTFDAVQIPSLGGVLISAMAFEDDGHVFFAGAIQSNSLNPNGDAVVFRMSTNLVLDQSFGQDGLAWLDMTLMPNAPVNEEVNQIAVQPDGKVLLAGNTRNGQNRRHMLLARFDQQGYLDAGFGNGGLANVKLAPPIVPVNNSQGVIHSIELQDNGKILACGIWGPYEGGWPTALIRFNANGNMDQTFGNYGLTSLGDNELETERSRLYLQPDGHAILAGTIDGLNGYDMAVSRVMTYLPAVTSLESTPIPVDGVSIYPNPVTDVPFSVAYTLADPQEVSIYVVNLAGQRVAAPLQHAFRGRGIQQEQLQLTNNLLAGHYVLQVVTPQGMQTTRMLKR